MLALLRQKKAKGFTLIELLIVVAIIGILAAIAIPNLMSAQRRSKYARAASDTKTATTQMIVYANDKNVYPPTFQDLRNMGYAAVSDMDPWVHAYKPLVNGVVPPATPPQQTDNVASCSEGPNNGNNCGADSGTGIASQSSGGTVGYSSVYGSWSGS